MPPMPADHDAERVILMSAGRPRAPSVPVPIRKPDVALDAAMILDSVVEAIIVFDPESLRVVESNRGTTELLGQAREALVGQSILDVLRGVEVEPFLKLVATLAADGKGTPTVLVDVVSGDGSSIPIEVVLQSIDPAAGSRVIVVIARDIRERIEAQIRLQRLAESERSRAAELNAVIRAMGEAVVVCAADGSITLVNPAGESIFPNVDERSYQDILAQLHDPEGTAPALGAAAGPVELPTAADHERWVEITTYPVAREATAAEDGGATIVVMRDVTDSRRREAVRETFIGVLSHELRTPLTTIFGGAKLLAREGSTLDEETRRGIFRDVLEEAERLQRLVDDVVALNRFGEVVGKVVGEVVGEPVLMQRLLPRVVQSEDGRWPGVAFGLRIAPGLPTVNADPTYVEQIVRNLLSNAAKYGGLNSTVTIEAEPGDDEVIVRVLDDGPGFALEERERLFDLFYRAARTATIAGGAGIGLFVCARLAAVMGGRIWAAPRDTGGAEFGFALPVLRE